MTFGSYISLFSPPGQKPFQHRHGQIILAHCHVKLRKQKSYARIAGRTIQDNQGYIDIKSKLNEGTTFYLYFPVVRNGVRKKKENIPVSAYKGNGQLVMVVDDSEEQRIIAESILKRLNYRTLSAASGTEALDKLRVEDPDILLLDMIMPPGMDGLETYRKVVAIKPRQKAVLASGFAETERVKEVQALGAGPFIKKPYTIETIGMAIKNELNL